MIRQDKVQLCVGLSEMQAYVRVETGEEEAVLAGLLRVASELCETFLNQALIARDFELELRPREGWSLLPVQPVRAIVSVRRARGGETIDASSYRIDIDHEGRGYLAGLAAGETFTVTGSTGMALDPNGVPEPVRQGILRLAAHLFTHRDGGEGELPRTVSALWRPYRRAGLCR
jgi:uncharacterized phiE125 gp8 family phage protein